LYFQQDLFEFDVNLTKPFTVRIYVFRDPRSHILQDFNGV